MPHFVYDDTELNYPKTDKKPTPAGENSKHLRASDWNNTNQALADVKSLLRGAKLYGLTPQAERPEVAGVQDFVWVNDDNELVLTVGGEDTTIGAGEVPAAREIAAEFGIDGGGDLGADRAFKLKSSDIGFISAKDPEFGAVGDGETDDRPAIEAAMAAAQVLGCDVDLGVGDFLASRDGSNQWCLNLPSNVRLRGVKGRTRIIAAPNMPDDTTVYTVFIGDVENVVLRDLIIDGNWGAEVDVTESNAGINHETQADPRNHAIILRGAKHVSIIDCVIKQTYGDHIWMGYSADDDVTNVTEDILIERCVLDISARNGITFGQACRRITIRKCSITNSFVTPIDTEPVGLDQAVRDITIENNYLGLWWDRGSHSYQFEKTGGTNGVYDAQAYSTETFSGTVSVEYVIPAASTRAIVGLSADNPDGSYTGIDFGLLDDAGTMFRSENGSLSSLGATAAGDVWRVTRTMPSGAVTYYKNGTLVSTSGSTSSAALLVDSSIRGTGETVERIRVRTTDGGQVITWNTSGVTVVNSGALNYAVTIAGGYVLGWNESSAARNIRIINNDIDGCIGIAGTTDVTIAQNRIVTDWVGYSDSPITIDHACDDITVFDNTVYDNTLSAAGVANYGCISVRHYGDGLKTYQPAGVTISSNRIHARNGRRGIFIDGPGGFTNADGTPAVDPVTGTATGVTNSTLTDSGAGWTSNQWAGWTVRRGSVHALVISNTTTVLTLQQPVLGGSAWRTPLGEADAAPSTGTYVITSLSGVVDVVNNTIDCGADGNNPGGYGIFIFNDRANGRIRVRENKIKNPTDYAIVVQGDDLKPIRYLDISDNVAWDDQATQTMSAMIAFFDQDSLTYIDKLIMRNNSVIGVTSGTETATPVIIGGGDAGYWIVNDGPAPDWEGFGSPEGEVVAPIGSTFRRLDGSSGSTMYFKESGSSDTGWVPVGTRHATGTITCIPKADYVDTDFMTIPDGINAPKLYEFDTAGNGVTGGRVQVNISTDTTAAQVAARLRTAILANQLTLDVTDNADGTLTVTHRWPGTGGNVTMTDDVADADHTVSGFTGGQG